jgi:hypothetical protein
MAARKKEIAVYYHEADSSGVVVRHRVATNRPNLPWEASSLSDQP